MIAVQNHTIKPRVVLPENYVKEVRPPSVRGTPVLVEFSVFVVDINSINVEDMDFRYQSTHWNLTVPLKNNSNLNSKIQIQSHRVDMFVHQKWKESRLTLHDELFEEGDDYVTLPPEFFDNLWQPDPYFLNSKVAGR